MNHEQLNPHTLFIDGTGSIIKKIEWNSERVFMYSIAAHIKREGNEKFLSRHFSTDIQRFLIYVRTLGGKNNIRWPIC